MNYLKIVLQGYFNDNNREFLEKYFFREYKKAEKEQFFEADEFFNGCLKVIDGWEKNLQDQVLEQKRELYLELNEAKNGTIKYAKMEGKTIEQKRQESIEHCEKELNDVRPDGIGELFFTVNLFSLTNGLIAYNMSYNEVLQIKLSIDKAFQKTQTNDEQLPPQDTNTNKRKPELNEFLREQITHPKKIEIAEAIKEKYNSFKGKDFRILYEALLELDLFPKVRSKSTFFRCLQNEKYNINNVQMLEDKYFKDGSRKPNGDYVKSEDEVQRDSIIVYLQMVIDTK